MNKKDLKKVRLPNKSGVYFFRGSRRRVLYVGKATSLRDRVKSYFGKDLFKTRGPRLVKMLEEAKSVDWVETDSVLEALILEANLIKKHQPLYNVKEKDDKSFNFVVITKEDYPRVLIVRRKDLHRKFDASGMKYIFGPYPAEGLFKEAMKLIRKIFPYRDGTCIPNSGKPCFNRQLKLCPGVCTGEISKRDYGKLIQHIKLFLEGRKGILIKRLEKEMKNYAKEQRFEKADEIKRRIFALKHIQDVSLIKREFRSPSTALRAIRGVRIEAYDVAHISGSSTVGAMVVVENSELKKSDYRKFKIRQSAKGSDTGALAEVLERRLSHTEWPLPRLIVVDGGKAQIHTAEKVLSTYGISIPVVSVVKDERHRPKRILGDKTIRAKYEHDILLANAEAHRFAISYHRQHRGKLGMKSS